MAVDVIGMYGTSTGGVANAIASVDIPMDGVIVGIDWDANVTMDADNEVFDAEFSFIATNQLATNDVRGRISSISAAMTITTSGITLVSIQKWLGSFDLVVAGGERVYVHVVATSGVVSVVRLNIFYDASGTVRRSARRR